MVTTIGWVVFWASAALGVSKIVGFLLTHNPAFLH